MRPILLLLLSVAFFSCETQHRATDSGWEHADRGYGGFEPNPNQVNEDNFNTQAYMVGQHGNVKFGRIDATTSFSQQKSEQSTEVDKPGVEKKIIYNANLSLNVKIPDSTNKELVNIADRYEGYAQSIATDYTVIRVKADKLEMALKDIEELGKIDYRNVKADDVTDAYYDFKIRLDNAERARSRYLELLAKAANVDETLKVEKELERLNGEIDLLKGKLTRIGHLTEYATISIRLHEKVKPGVLGYVFVGLWEGVKWLFVRG